MAGYSRQSAATIINGLVVEAQPINNELNAIETAMAVTGGHNHDGTAGGGAPISLVNSVTGTLGLDRGGTNANLTGAVQGSFITMGSGSLTFLKHNIAGTSTPTVSNDSSQGYSVLSLWLLSGSLYICTDSTAGAAVWVPYNDANLINASITKVKVSTNDTTPQFISQKLTFSDPLTGIIVTTGGVETFRISAALANATTSLTGIIALATTAQVVAGTDTFRAVTPAALLGAGNMVKADNLSGMANASTSFDNIKQQATTSYSGVVELATSGEVNTGTDVSRAITPAGLAGFMRPLMAKRASTIGSGTVATTAFNRYLMSGVAVATLPTFAADEWVMVEFGSNLSMTVGRNAQTIDGASADDICNTKGPIILYYCTSAGVVVTKLLGSIPS